jgi:hypothetical protein
MSSCADRDGLLQHALRLRSGSKRAKARAQMKRGCRSAHSPPSCFKVGAAITTGRNLGPDVQLFTAPLQKAIEEIAFHFAGQSVSAVSNLALHPIFTE